MSILNDYIRDNKEIFIDLSSILYFSDMLENQIKDKQKEEKVKLDKSRKKYYEKHSLI